MDLISDTQHTAIKSNRLNEQNMSEHNLTFRLPGSTDAADIMRIHKMGLDTGHASFRDTPIGWTEFERAYLDEPSAALVVTDGENVLGWATVVPSSQRAVYAGVGEISIYLDSGAQGQGVGSALMQAIIEAAEQKGFWTLFAHIFPQNQASIALHRKFGFDTIGRRKAIGKMTYGPMAGKWRDVMLMERRSRTVGLD